jgi:PAS domain S-box-containing protein
MLGRITTIMNMTEEEIKNHPHLLVNVIDQEYRVLFWNRQCEKHFGIGEAEALGKTLEDLIPGIMENEKTSHLRKALSGQPVYLVNVKYDNKAGSYDQVVIPVKKDNNTVFAVLNIIIDLLSDRNLSQRIIPLPDKLSIDYSED